MRKKFLLPLLGLLALPAVAATTGENFTYEGIVYTVLSSEEKTASTVEGSSRDYYSENSYLTGDVVIPEIVMDEEGNEYTVTEIADISFSAGDLTTVTIPKTVTNIGYLAFAYCDNLVAIYNYSGYPQQSYYNGYPYSLSGNYAFDSTTTENITVYVAENALSAYANWGGYTWKAIEPIEGYTFDYPQLEEGERFDYNGISYEVVSSTDFTCITSANTWSGSDYPQDTYLSGKVVIPSVVEANGNSYTVIGVGEGSFYYAGYYSRNGFSLVLPETIQYIDDEAFEYASLTSIEIDASALTYLGIYAFYQNSSLKSVVFTGTPGEEVVLTFGGDMTSTGHQFQKCTALQTLVLPTSLVNIPYRCLDDCTAISPDLVIPRNVKEIGQYGIRNCNSINTLVLPASLQTFTKNGIRSADALTDLYEFSTVPPVLNAAGIAFSSSYINSPNINLYVPRQGVQAYEESSDTEWNELGWKSIQEISFEDEGFSYVVLNDTDAILESVEPAETLTIPTTAELYTNIFDVTAIAEGAIDGTELVSVTVETLTPPAAAGAFENLNPDAVLYVPAEAVAAYQAAEGWNEFYRIRPIGYEAPSVVDNLNVLPQSNTTVEELATITISSDLFTNLIAVGSSILVNDNETEVTADTNEDGELVITLMPAINEMGDYNVVIPAGFFTYMEDIYTEESPELSLNVNIAAKVVSVEFSFADDDAVDFVTAVVLDDEPVADWAEGFDATQTQTLTLTFDMTPGQYKVEDITLNGASILEDVVVTDNVGVYTTVVETENLDFNFNVSLYAEVNVSLTFPNEVADNFVNSVTLDNTPVENWVDGFMATEGQELVIVFNMVPFGYLIDDVTLNGESILLDLDLYGAEGYYTVEVGTENLAFDLDLSIDPTSGINGLNADELGNAEVYTLSGARVHAKNLQPGIYVIRKDGRTAKVVVR